MNTHQAALDVGQGLDGGSIGVRGAGGSKCWSVFQGKGNKEHFTLRPGTSDEHGP